MKPFQIVLDTAEAELVGRVEFDPLCIVDYESNADAAVELFRRLVARGAIPEQRRRYFADPTFNAAGRGRSRQDVFQRNGCRGDAILRHPHFLPYLRYFSA